MAELRAHLGAKIAHYRSRAKLTQEALASAIGVSQNTIYRIENGKSWPEYDNLAAIAAALNVTPEAFFEDLTSTGRPPTPQQALDVLRDFVGSLATLNQKELASIIRMARETSGNLISHDPGSDDPSEELG